MKKSIRTEVAEVTLKSIMASILKAYKELLAKDEKDVLHLWINKDGFADPVIEIEDELVIYEGQVMQETILGKHEVNAWFIVDVHDNHEHFTSVDSLIKYVVEYFFKIRLHNYWKNLGSC